MIHIKKKNNSRKTTSQVTSRSVPGICGGQWRVLLCQTHLCPDNEGPPHTHCIDIPAQALALHPTKTPPLGHCLGPGLCTWAILWRSDLGRTHRLRPFQPGISRFQFPRTSLEVGEGVSLDLGDTSSWSYRLFVASWKEGENGALKV